MIKYLKDANNARYYKDELLVRCDCGCSILSIRVLEIRDEAGKVVQPALELVHYNSELNEKYSTRKHIKASHVLFTNLEIIKVICEILAGKMNDGCGYVESDSDLFLGINTWKEKNIVVLSVLHKERDIAKMERSVKAVDTIPAWNVFFSDKNREEITNFIRSKFENFVNFEEEADVEIEVENNN